MEMKLLADVPYAVPTIARWWFEEWGNNAPGRTPQTTEAEVRASANRDRAPLGVVAVDGERVLGVAVWKPHEMKELYPDREHWLGGVYVASEARGRGLASGLCQNVIKLAREGGAPHLHLQTIQPDGGLYARLGWEPIERTHHHGHDVLVMVRSLRNSTD